MALFIVLAAWLLAQSQTESPALDVGRTRVRDLTVDSPQDYYILLSAGQYARLNIAQHTVNVAVTVFNTAGKELFALDNTSIGEAEVVEFIAVTSGKYRVRVSASEAHAPAGRYEITL